MVVMVVILKTANEQFTLVNSKFGGSAYSCDSCRPMVIIVFHFYRKVDNEIKYQWDIERQYFQDWLTRLIAAINTFMNNWDNVLTGPNCPKLY